MNLLRPRFVFWNLAILFAAGFQILPAQSNYVDTNGSSSGLGSGGANITWSTSVANWNNNDYNDNAPVAWIDGSVAYFNKHSYYNVTVSGTVEVANMYTSYATTFSGGTINFGSGAREIFNNVTGADTFTINSAVTGTGSLTMVGSTVSSVTFTGAASLTNGFNAIKGTTTFSGSGASLTTNATGDINVGGGSESYTAVLNFTGGADLTNGHRLYVGTGSGTGTVNVSGSDSTIDVDQYIWIGNAGSSEGTLNITSGADVTTGTTVSVGDVTGSAGTLNVNGASSTLAATGNIYVGYDSSGTALFNSGAAVSTDAIFFVGANPTGDGDLTVDGSGTTLNVGTDLLTGSKHISELTTSTSTSSIAISNSAAVTVGETVTIADLSGANDTVTLISNGRLIVADQGGNNGIHAGSGTATFVLNGGELELNTAVSSVLTVDLATSLSANSTLDAANGTITYNGVLSGTAGLIVASSNGGTVKLTGDNLFSGDSTINSGIVDVANSSGSALGTGAVTVQSGASLTGTGSFTGALTLDVGAILAPGNSPGLMTIGSGSTFNGTLNFEIGGLTRGTQYDAINIDGAGNLTFGGILNVSLINDFVPSSGDSFDLFNYTTATGTFETLNLASLTTGLSWDTSTLYTTGVISVTTSAVPEPSTYALFFGIGAIGFAVWHSRRAKA